MKRFLLTISTLFFIISSTELHQLARLPLLVKHYLHHRSEGTSLSFTAFLQLHYTDKHPSDNDEGDDEQLPFKSPESISHTDIPVQESVEIDTRANFRYVNGLEFYHNEGTPIHISYAFFRPPRII